MALAILSSATPQRDDRLFPGDIQQFGSGGLGLSVVRLLASRGAQVALTYRSRESAARAAVETAREWICLAKTSAARYADVETAIRELHSYEEPEIVATPIVAGSQGYLDWIGDNTKGAS